MNRDRLLALYDQVAEAPNSIARLRHFVIDIAISRGFSGGSVSWANLPIEECLEPLNGGKSIHQGWSPRCKTFPASSAAKWGVLKTTAVQNGFFLEDENKELPDHLSPKENLEIAAGDILMTCAGPRARCGIACWVPSVRPRLMISGKMYRFRADRSQILTEYLALFLRSSEAWNAIDAMKTGSSESGLNLTKDRFRKLKVCFGSLDEQRRILAKVEELMALLDRLETARTAREATRDRLTVASVARLTTSDSDPEGFSRHARFALDALPALTARPEQIKVLRQTIFNLAVRGELVEPDSSDEPASSLIEEIHVAGKKVNKPSAEPDMTMVDFSIPPHWVWQSLDEILMDGPQNGLSPRKSQREDSPKAITLTATTSGTFDARQFKYVEVSFTEAARYWLEPGDLLFQRGNTREYVGMAAIYDGPPKNFLFPDLIMRVRISPNMDLRFVHLWCIAPFARHFLSSNATGAQKTMPKINQGVLRSLPVPVPPVAEQSRIVARVDALMSVCDRLEAALTAIETTRAHLLESTLHKSLAASSSDREAA